MSQERQPLVRSYAVTHPPDLHLDERSYGDFNQLVYALRGVMDVRTSEGRWIVPPHRAVWIPARTSHSIHMEGQVSLRTLFFRRQLGRGRVPRSCRAVNVTPLLRELILAAFAGGEPAEAAFELPLVLQLPFARRLPPAPKKFWRIKLYDRRRARMNPESTPDDPLDDTPPKGPHTLDEIEAWEKALGGG